MSLFVWSGIKASKCGEGTTMKRILFVPAMVLGVLLTVGQAPSFALNTVLQFDEAGHISITTNNVAVTGSTVGTGAYDSLGGGTLAYTLPSGYTFALATGVNQYGVLVTDSSSMVSDLLIFQNSSGKGQVLVYDSPGANALELGNGDLAHAYLLPQQGGVPYSDSTWVNPTSHPEYLNSPTYMQLALGIFGSTFATSTVLETFVNGGTLSGLGVELIGGKSTIQVPGVGSSTTFDFFVSEVPEPSTFALAGLGAAALLIFRRRK